MRFIEIFLAGIDPSTGDIVAECYGTYANPDIPADKDSAPLVARLNMNQIKRQYGVLGASLNGPIRADGTSLGVFSSAVATTAALVEVALIEQQITARRNRRLDNNV